jgi:hypothetical protein
VLQSVDATSSAKKRDAVLVNELSEIRNKALRRRVWFAVLNRTERAIVNLVIKCVRNVRSIKLAKIVDTVVNKLRDSMKGQVEKMMEKFGRPMARKISRLAQLWGNSSAASWIEDPDFFQYLVINHINSPNIFKQ